VVSTVEEAVSAVRAGRLVVMPTDTVYGLGADAFSPAAVNALLAAKRRGRDMPVPVLVGSWQTLDGICDEVTPTARKLVEAYWPGALSLLFRAQPSLAWDLGDAYGTVLVRMPLHPMALDVLAATGPMAVSSANRSGQPPATTVDEARAQLGGAVAVYLDGGPTASSVPSTIVDVSQPDHPPRVLRLGAISSDELRVVAPDLIG
jgi:L-threonylcarbamoyladenylate synthase